MWVASENEICTCGDGEKSELPLCWNRTSHLQWLKVEPSNKIGSRNRPHALSLRNMMEFLLPVCPRGFIESRSIFFASTSWALKRSRLHRSNSSVTFSSNGFVWPHRLVVLHAFPVPPNTQHYLHLSSTSFRPYVRICTEIKLVCILSICLVNFMFL